MSEGKKVAVLGAGAYMGGPLLRGLQKHGYLTVGIARSSTNLSGIDQFCSEIRQGDLADPAFIQQAIAGCSAVINVVSQLNPPCESLIAQLENDVPILEACLFAGLKSGAQVIHTSGNFSTPLKGKSGGIDGRETISAPNPSGPFLDHWPNFEHIPEMQAVATLAEAKCRTDLVLHNFVHSHPKANACVIIPAATYGPSIGNRVSFWDHAVEWYQAGQFQDFMTGFIHMEDLVAAYIAAVERGKPGERYLVAGEPMRVSEFVRLYCEAEGSLEFNTKGSAFENTEGLFYDDSFTRAELQVSWKRNLKESLPPWMAHKRQHADKVQAAK